jgi:putative tryptophan/tyrosine transport system substrate-binding protein
MRRRVLLGVAGAVTALAAIRTVRAQSTKRMIRIGYLATGSFANDRTRPAFVEGLRELGYVEGRNLQIEYRAAENDFSRLPALAAELVALRPDVIVAANPAGVGAAFAATKAIPIVMGTMSDPVLEGFVKSLGRPGGNVTGVVNQGEDLIPKHFELVRSLLPRARRVGFLINPAPVLQLRTESFVAAARTAAAQLKFDLSLLHASNRANLEALQAGIARERAEALIVALDPVFLSLRRIVVDTVGKLGLPAVYPLPNYSEDGGLLSYGFNLGDSFKRAASFVDRILKGARPGDLPIERPLKFELVVNLKTANQLRLTIPQTVLLRADRVIE